MKVAVLTTHTPNTVPVYGSLLPLGHQLEVFTYDKMEHAEHWALPGKIAEFDPDFVVMIGAIEKYHVLPVVKIPVLQKIAEDYKIVHLCFDAADRPWWPYLEEYHRAKCFALQVNIDGVKRGPIGEFGLTLLTPVDPAIYAPKPWRERATLLGFAGSKGHGSRCDTLDGLLLYGLVRQLAERYVEQDAFINFMTSCKGVINHPMTGSGRSLHVKGRVIETALAGAVLFEAIESPTCEWFEPDVDYVGYSNLKDVSRGLAWMIECPEEAEAMAARLRAKVLVEHSPAAFWNKITSRIL